jgi:hypothetical protein
MKRSLDKNKNNNEENNIIKKTVEQEIDEINDLLNNILIEESNIDIIINIDTIKKEIYINENVNKKEKNRKYKYGNEKLESMINIIYEDFMYKNINSIILYLDNKNLFVNKEDWKDQLFNDISYIKIFEEEEKRENEFINLNNYQKKDIIIINLLET